MQDASNGASGDVTCDGAGASSQAVTTADKLRNLADWLDAHSGARPDVLSLIDAIYGGTVKVSDHGCRSLADMTERERAIGGEWVREDSETMTRSEQAIMPGFEYQILASKSLMCPVPDSESDVPF